MSSGIIDNNDSVLRILRRYLRSTTYHLDQVLDEADELLSCYCLLHVLYVH